MTRLLIFCNDYAYFMAHRYALFSELPNSGVEVVAYCGAVPADARPRLAFPIGRYACDRYRLRPFRDLFLLVQMLFLLFRHRPDVLHTITLKPNLIGGIAARLYTSLSRRRCRLVMMTPGLGRVFANGASQRRGLREKLVAAGLRHALSSRASHAVFENGADRDFWVGSGIVPLARAHVVQGAGVDSHAFAGQATRLPPPPLKVLFASRLLKSKGIGPFLDLAAEAGRRGLDAGFVVAGQPDANDSDSVDLAGKTLPKNVDYVGHCDDMPKLLASAHVVVLPTIYAEGLPRILIEAAAMACVLMASDIAGCRRIVEDGTNGFLLPIADGKVDMQVAIDRLQLLADNPDEVARMGAAARASFLQGGFDLESVRKQIGSILFDRL